MLLLQFVPCLLLLGDKVVSWLEAQSKAWMHNPTSTTNHWQVF